MSDGWQTQSLGDIATVGAGNSAPQDKSRFVNGEYLFIRTADVGQVRFGSISTAKDKLNEDGIGNLKLIRKGTILMPKSGASTFLNHRVIMENAGYVASHLATVYPDPVFVEARYLLYFLSTVKAQDLIQDQKYPSLNLSTISDIEVPCPALAEQKRISAILDEAFSAIAKAKENTEKNLANARELFESYLNRVFTQQGEGWVELNLADVVESLHQGLNTAGQKVKFYESGYPIIQTRNIDEGVVELDTKIKLMCEDDWLLYKDKYRPAVGDVFFTNIGTIGKTAIVTVDRDYLIHWNIFKLRPRQQTITSPFLKYTLDHLTSSGYFKNLQKGGTVDFVTKKMISDSLVHLPNTAEQTEIVAKLDAFNEETLRLETIYEQKLANLDELKQSLLQKAFTGQLTAKTVELEMAV